MIAAHDEVGNCNGAGVSQRIRGSGQARFVEDHGLDARIGCDAVGGRAARRANHRAPAGRNARDADPGGINRVEQRIANVSAAGEHSVDHQGQVADAGNRVRRVERHDRDDPVAGHELMHIHLPTL